MARPTKLAHEKREHRHNLRFTTAEIAHIAEQAARAQLPVTDYLRARATGHVVASPRSGVDAQLVHQLNALGQELKAIGNNVNQLARAANSGRTYRGLPVAALSSQLQSLASKVDSTLTDLLDDVRHHS